MKKLFLFTVLFCFCSCGAKESIPDDIMSKEEMVEALIEIRILEGQVNTLNISSDSSKILYYILEKRLFQELELDTALYTKSNNYYLLHPEHYLDITSAVIDSLKLRNQKLSMPKAQKP